jgi:hypothetical protein
VKSKLIEEKNMRLYSRGTHGNHEKTLVRIASIWADTSAWNLPDTTEEVYTLDHGILSSPYLLIFWKLGYQRKLTTSTFLPIAKFQQRGGVNICICLCVCVCVLVWVGVWVFECTGMWVYGCVGVCVLISNESHLWLEIS